MCLARTKIPTFQNRRPQSEQILRDFYSIWVKQGWRLARSNRVKSAEICHFEASSDISLYPKKINPRPNYGTRVLSCDATQIHPERDALSRTPVMCAPLITGGVPVAPTGCAQRSVCPLESIRYRRWRRAPTIRGSLGTDKSVCTTLRQRFYSVFTSITR